MNSSRSHFMVLLAVGCALSGGSPLGTLGGEPPSVKTSQTRTYVDSVTYSLAPSRQDWAVEIYSDGSLDLIVGKKREVLRVHGLSKEEFRKLTSNRDRIFQLASSSEVLEAKEDPDIVRRIRFGHTHYVTIIVEGAHGRVLRSFVTTRDPQPPKLRELCERLEEFCDAALSERKPKPIILE